MADKRYYWLKLKKDFFKRHDIKIIESMPNGKDYILFYLKLLVEGVDHEGELRFSETIPYNEQMLSTITDTNIDIVRSAMKVFQELHMIEVLEDSTIYMAEVNKMLGSETYWAEQKRKKRLNVGKCPSDVQLVQVMSKQEIDIEKDIDIISEKKQRNKIPPSLEDVKEYCTSRNNGIDAESFIDYYQGRGWYLTKGVKMKDWRSAIRTWEKNRKKDDPKEATYTRW